MFLPHRRMSKMHRAFLFSVFPWTQRIHLEGSASRRSLSAGFSFRFHPSVRPSAPALHQSPVVHLSARASPPILSSQSYNIHQAVRQPIYISPPPPPPQPHTPVAPPAVVHPQYLPHFCSSLINSSRAINPTPPPRPPPEPPPAPRPPGVGL